MKPIRVQRKRSKGWKMPPKTVCVDRTTRWGNPFVVSRSMTREDSLKLFRAMLAGYVCVSAGIEPGVQEAYYTLVSHSIEELRGKNLACWCRLDQQCHADILLEIANRNIAKRVESREKSNA